MPAFYAADQSRHDPQTFMVLGQFRRAEEVPERAERLLAGGRAAGLAFTEPAAFDPAVAAAVHTPEYLRFLAEIHDRWSEIPGAAPEVIPNMHLDRRLGGYPTAPAGLAGYHQADAACPIGAGTWAGAQASAATATAAAHAVRDGAPAAYALCRPPGHHAYADLAGGFCFLNNSAIAARLLRGAHDRVAVLDVDVHHGNGTQGIFYGAGDVLTVSLHADPVDYYPFVQGHAHERGEGPGHGANRNLPLPRTTEDEDYLTALDDAILTIRAFAPGALVLALGLDAYRGDPLKGMQLSTGAFEAIGQRVAGIGLPTVVVQEGGYLCDDLGANLTAFLTGLQEGLPHA
ncbi:MAG: histone deacetylase family protein [Pseudomonadota bacterium]